MTTWPGHPPLLVQPMSNVTNHQSLHGRHLLADAGAGHPAISDVWQHSLVMENFDKKVLGVSVVRRNQN